MNNSAKRHSILLVCLLFGVAAPPVKAVPNGCTLLLPPAIQDSLDSLLLGACDRHDACWQALNPCGGPYLGINWKASCDAQFLADLTGVCATATTILSFPNFDYSNEDEFLEDCEAGAAAAYAGVSVAFPAWNRTQCDEGCNLNACQAIGRSLPLDCCFSCQCLSDIMCDFLPAPEWGTWECMGCFCVLTNSPLVLHLPDYLSTEGSPRSWWKEGFCGSEGPTICLDWRGDGNVTCTAWTSPTSDVAFVVRLTDADVLHLAAGESVGLAPWRHFFGNVTKGPEGEFPFGNGFEALAAYCEQGTEVISEIDLAECGASLYAWVDRSGDGRIDPDEPVNLQALGIERLGKPRETGKKDRCGNTFPAESHAFCSNRSGPCGTWLDVFFETRYPGSRALELTDSCISNW